MKVQTLINKLSKMPRYLDVVIELEETDDELVRSIEKCTIKNRRQFWPTAFIAVRNTKVKQKGGRLRKSQQKHS
jgi:hypothetical protein